MSLLPVSHVLRDLKRLAAFLLRDAELCMIGHMFSCFRFRKLVRQVVRLSFVDYAHVIG